jgi:amidohydrolase
MAIIDARRVVAFLAAFVMLPTLAPGENLERSIQGDYESHLWPLFQHFHRNPELSLMESKTAARMARELRDAGYTVTEGVGGTGVVALLDNGPGPLVMMRADMDALPVEEKTSLDYASRVTQVDWDGNEVSVMHACGHDVHITSLVGTARIMAKSRDTWSGTLMLVVQPAEERVAGAKMMMEDGLWQRFGKPDYAIGFHVDATAPAGKLRAVAGAAYSGADSVDIIVHGIGTHGASPQQGKDPIVLASEIVLALQTVVTRDLAPREAGIITVGSFHAGTKHNIIPDHAHLQLTVRNDGLAGRRILLEGIERVAVNMGRVAGMPEDKLPEVIVSDESVPPLVNDVALTERLRAVWASALGSDIFFEEKRQHMGAEDFPFFTMDPAIRSTFFQVGGTPQAAFDREAAGGERVAGHHSPLFQVAPEESITLGVRATVIALRELLQQF